MGGDSVSLAATGTLETAGTVPGELATPGPVPDVEETLGIISLSEEIFGGDDGTAVPVCEDNDDCTGFLLLMSLHVADLSSIAPPPIEPPPALTTSILLSNRDIGVWTPAVLPPADEGTTW